MHFSGACALRCHRSPVSYLCPRNHLCPRRQAVLSINAFGQTGSIIARFRINGPHRNSISNRTYHSFKSRSKSRKCDGKSTLISLHWAEQRSPLRKNPVLKREMTTISSTTGLKGNARQMLKDPLVLRVCEREVDEASDASLYYIEKPMTKPCPAPKPRLPISTHPPPKVRPRTGTQMRMHHKMIHCINERLCPPLTLLFTTTSTFHLLYMLRFSSLFHSDPSCILGISKSRWTWRQWRWQRSRTLLKSLQTTFD